VAGYVPMWFNRPWTVTRAWRRVTSLIKVNALRKSHSNTQTPDRQMDSTLSYGEDALAWRGSIAKLDEKLTVGLSPRWAPALTGS